MVLLHRRAHEVLQTLREIESNVRDLRSEVENSMRRNDKRGKIFAPFAAVNFSVSVQDQLPESLKGTKFTGGVVVAVDYRTQKVTVNCGSTESFDPHTIHEFDFVLDFDDVFINWSYDTELDESDTDRGYDSNA